jgi:hypothetical protein
VVCDRFADSTRAYQGAGGGVSPDFIAAGRTRAVVGDHRPNLTLVFDLPPETGLERAFGRDMFSEVRFESKGLDFHNRLRAAYLEIARAEPDRCVLIDASGDRETVAGLVWTAVMDRLGLMTDAPVHPRDAFAAGGRGGPGTGLSRRPLARPTASRLAADRTRGRGQGDLRLPGRPAGCWAPRPDPANGLLGSAGEDPVVRARFQPARIRT